MNTDNISIAKIVSTPTPSSWSQAYNAGNLFAVLSLASSSEENNDLLNNIGKEIIDTLEKEYYILEEKNLDSIKQALNTALEKAPPGLLISITVSAIVQKERDILYVFSKGKAKAILKRGEKLGKILESEDELTCTSGFLANKDIIIFATSQFSKIISASDLTSAIDHNSPSDIAESLSPKIHEKEEGGAAAIIISYKKTSSEYLTPGDEIKEPNIIDEEVPSETNEKKEFFLTPYFLLLKNKLSFSKQSLTHSKKVFLTIAVILLIIFITSAFFAVKRQDEAKTQALFAGIFPQAQQKYDEGQSLIGLNKNLAREDFSKAKEILQNAKTKFKPGSKEEKEITTLLAKVETSLASALENYNTDGKAVDENASKILSFEKNNSSALFLTQDNKNVYVIDEKGISSMDKQTQKGKQIIKNDKYWSDPSGIGIYLGNIYILDKKSNQIFKFVAGSFTKTNYFPNASMDFSNASSMTIDGSIYVLFKNGTINKFTKGKQDDFNISGLDKPLLNPLKIFTGPDTNNIYILDNGNSRILVLDKKGNYQSQYSAKILKDAKDFEVLEKEKKIYVLSDNKIYEIDIK